MPYVNIPDSNLAGGIANIVGKMTGNLSNKIATASASMAAELREGALTRVRTSSLRNKHQKLSNNVTKINRRISKFNKIAKALKAVIGGLSAALAIVLAIPIPQAFPHVYVGPPGLPVNISTKYADILHKLKELIKQLKDNIAAILLITQIPNFLLAFLTRQLQRMDNALMAMEVRIALEEEVLAGRLNKQELQDLGLLDEDGVYIFSRLGPIFVGDADKDTSKACNLTTFNKVELPPFGRPGKYDGIIEKYNFVPAEVSAKIPFNEKAQLVKLNGLSLKWSERNLRWACYSENDALKDLDSKLLEIDRSNIPDDIKDRIKAILDRLKNLDKEEEVNPNKFLHRGPDGTLYRLYIIPDENSPAIAPRSYAIAKDPSGVTVLKGPKSFSSDVDVLLEEIKFRIDNQLP